MLLVQPLNLITELSDLELVKKVKEECDNDSMIELISRHEKICCKVMSFYSKIYGGSYSDLRYENLLQDIPFVINKSIKSFNSKKRNKFSSWVYLNCRFHVLGIIDIYKKNSNIEYTENIEELVDSQFKIYPKDNTDFKYSLDLLSSLSDKRIRRIIELRISLPSRKNGWKTIATELKINPNLARTLYLKGIKILREKLSKEFNKYE